MLFNIPCILPLNISYFEVTTIGVRRDILQQIEK